MTGRIISFQDVAKHNSRDDCWCVIHGKVYNLTPFLDSHPGGAGVIVKQAGKDATEAFDPIHPKDIIDRFLPKDLYLGDVDEKTLPKSSESADQKARQMMERPALGSILNSFDFEAVARKVLKPEAWAYYSSGADDELTLQENHAAFHRIWLRPRVLVNVRDVDTSTTMLGSLSNLPIYISATALGKLGHKEGEVVLTRGAGKKGIIQMMPTLASCSMDEMVDARIDGQTQWFQLYVNSDRKITERLVRHAEKRGAKGLFITVDAPQLGRREKDMRTKFVDDAPDVQSSSKVERNEGAARAISSFIDPALSWDDIAWFKSITSMPIVLKGVQAGEDAVLAAQSGIAGIVVSNHGGRQLDTSRSGIEVLEEVMQYLHAANIDTSPGNFEVFVDGGFRRGTDIFKALALGARGIGLGRPFLYAMSSYGQEGVERLIDLLRAELEMVMRLMGVRSLADIQKNMVITKTLSSHAGSAPVDSIGNAVYERPTPVFSAKL
ncbi:FMN-dependent dehydrogenase-domain-containing protein [Phlyctochytrium arcticum]|nr:FMN-dependent dehydrogenase-domain-containing protein [Phlyctochytrium arcticum]